MHIICSVYRHVGMCDYTQNNNVGIQERVYVPHNIINISLSKCIFNAPLQPAEFKHTKR